MTLTILMIWTIVSMWILGIVVLVYYGLAHLFAKEYQFAAFFILFAILPPTAIIASVVIYAGLIRYFLFLTPKNFKQFITDLKDELMFDLWRVKP